MQFEQLEALLGIFAKSDAVSLVWEQGEEKIALKKAAAYSHSPASPLPCSAPVAEQLPPAQAPISAETINAPLVGTFYAAPAPDKAPFAAVGVQVKKGQTVCLLEAMKMMSEVPAPFDCIIEEVLIADGELAAFGTPLFRISRI